MRGTLKSVTEGELVITSREGEVVGFKLDPKLGVYAVTPATIDDVKQGQFVGLTTVMTGDRQVALEAHLFADDLRGLGEGHYAWDLVKGPNMMTNATVAQIKEVGADRELKVSYQEGEPKIAGTQTIYLPPDVPIVHMAKAERALLAPGKDAVLLVNRIATRPRSWSRSWSATRAPNHPCERRPCRLCGTMAAPGGGDRAGAGLLQRPTGRGRMGTGAGSSALGHPGGALRSADRPVR